MNLEIDLLLHCVRGIVRIIWERNFGNGAGAGGNRTGGPFDQAWIKYACAQASVGSVMARKEQGGVASTLRELAYASRKTTPVPIDSRMGRVENANRPGTNKGS